MEQRRFLILGIALPAAVLAAVAFLWVATMLGIWLFLGDGGIPRR